MFGPGVERSGLKANEPTHFTVDCTEAGEGEIRLRPPPSLSLLEKEHPYNIWRAVNCEPGSSPFLYTVVYP